MSGPYRDENVRRERHRTLYQRHPALAAIANKSPIVSAHISHGIANGWLDEQILAVTLVAVAEHAESLMRMHIAIAERAPIAPIVLGKMPGSL